MKTLLASVAAVAALTAVAAPAAAQPYGYDRSASERSYDRGDRYGGHQVDRREERIAHQIERGLRNGSLTRREAARLHNELRDIERLEARARYGGLSRWERAQLDNRLDRLEARLQSERHDNDYARRW